MIDRLRLWLACMFAEDLLDEAIMSAVRRENWKGVAWQNTFRGRNRKRQERGDEG